jgi:hypothetical protein
MKGSEPSVAAVWIVIEFGSHWVANFPEEFKVYFLFRWVSRSDCCQCCSRSVCEPSLPKFSSSLVLLCS